MAENYEGLPPEIEKLSERLAKDPKSLVFSSLANAYRKNNMVDEAIEILQKGLELHPNYASARIVLGKCYVDKRMYELAKEQFKIALESDPQNIVVLENLGRVYKTLNQNAEAFEIFKRLLDLDPLNESFERQVEELKSLTKDIGDSSGQYDTFQTIPDQTPREEEPEQGEQPPEPESNAPTLSDIFDGVPSASEESPSQEVTPSDESVASPERPNIISTAADFSDMFDAQEQEEPPAETAPPVSEEPPTEASVEETSITQEETVEMPVEEPSVPQENTESPIEHGPPSADFFGQPEPHEQAKDELATEPEPIVEEVQPPIVETPTVEQASESVSAEEDRIEGITSAFDEGGLETATESTAEELQESLTPDVDTIASELSEELSRDETVESEIPLESVIPTVEKTETEAPSIQPEVQPESPPARETPPEPEQKTTATETLAEIYISQGFTDKALEIYRELLAKDPENDSLKQKIAKLEQQLATEGTASTQPPAEEPQPQEGEDTPSEQDRRNQSKNLDSFQDWLKKFQK